MYARAREKQEAETRSYRVYVTDALRMQGEGKYPAERWLDIIAPRKPIKEDTRPCGEIAAGIWERIKGD